MCQVNILWLVLSWRILYCINKLLINVDSQFTLIQRIQDYLCLPSCPMCSNSMQFKVFWLLCCMPYSWIYGRLSKGKKKLLPPVQNMCFGFSSNHFLYIGVPSLHHPKTRVPLGSACVVFYIVSKYCWCTDLFIHV